jgi:putative RecB family exonuclease
MQLSEKELGAIAECAAVKRKEKLLMPKRLSPTAVTAFRECAQSFLFRSLWKLPEPPSKVLEKGIVVHDTLERIFAVPAAERRSRLHDTLRDVWRERRSEELVASLFGSREEERAWGQECLHLLDNYLAVEDPEALTMGDPVAREAWASAVLAPADGSVPELSMVGRIDRIDRNVGAEGSSITVIDYKTGRAPSLKYSEAVNSRIRQEAFFQLRCYALMISRGEPLTGARHASTASAVLVLPKGRGG